MKENRIFPFLGPGLTAGFFLFFAAMIAAAGPEAGLSGPCTVPGDHATIQSAVNDPACATIDVAAGTYYESVIIGFGRTVTIQGQGQGQTVVDGTAANRVFYVDFGAVATLTDLTIQNGYTDRGAGIYNQGQLTVTSGTLNGNSVSDRGGAIANEGTMTIHNSTVSVNSAANGSGGGILNDGSMAVENSTLFGNSAGFYGGGIFNGLGGTLSVTGSTLLTNNAIVDGGGIYHDSGTAIVNDSSISGNWAGHQGGGINNRSTLIIENSAVSDNSANYGGGVWNDDTVTVTNSILSGNSANSFGGGVVNVDLGKLTITKCTLSTNSATVLGGGIFQATFGTTTINDSTFVGNSAYNGGGINNNNGTVTVNNSTLSGNSAPVGGAIYNGGSLTVNSSTVSGNSANRGGGIDAYVGYASISNTILAGNTATSEGPECWGTLSSQDYNLVEDTTNCYISGNTAHNITGQDPLLGALQANGGPTWTRSLLEGSPAVDAGSCPGATADQRGFARPMNQSTIANAADGCDMGAYEVEGEWAVLLPVVMLMP
jgi:hypothetical protein